MTFAYTGLASIVREETHLWLLHTLATVQTRMAGSRGRGLCTGKADFPRIQVRDPTHKAHAFVGAGWHQNPNTGVLSPVLATVSNVLDPTGAVVAAPLPTFSVGLNQWGWHGEKFAIAGHGVLITEHEKNAIWKLMHRVMKREPSHAEVLYAMRRCVHYVANKHKEWVGHGQLAMCLPKLWAERSLTTTGYGFVFGWPPENDMPSFFHWPFDGNQLVTYGPRMV